MSTRLLELATEFLSDERDPIAFVDQYMSMWKQERDAGILATDDAKLSEALSTIFCLADMFNPRADREEYEFDEPRLREEIRRTLSSATE